MKNGWRLSIKVILIQFAVATVQSNHKKINDAIFNNNFMIYKIFSRHKI